VVPQLFCLFYLRYLWFHNCSVPSVSGTCGATTTLSLLSQVPVVSQPLCLFYLRYLWCHNYSVSSISGTCSATIALFPLPEHLYTTHSSSCHLSARPCTTYACCCLPSPFVPRAVCYGSLATIPLLRKYHTPTAVACRPALVTITMANWGPFPWGGRTVMFSI
jgi:hypothetical protein